MAKPSKAVTEIQREFLPVGTEIAELASKLGQMGAYQAMRHVQAAADSYHEDVQRIVDLRKRKKA